MKELTFIEDKYETGVIKINLFSKTSPTLFFYSKLLPIVMDASIKAKRHVYDDQEWVRSSLKIIRLLESVGVQINIEGISNIENLKEPCVFVANHMSTLETFALPAIINPIKKITFVVKDDLIKYPVFKHVMISRNPIVVSRKNPREDLKAVIGGGTERLRSNISIVIFPQTTRANYFDPHQFNTIGIKLAIKANCPIIPIALKTDAWGTGKFIKDFGKINPSKKVYFAFGRPMWIKGRGVEEHNKVIEFISTKLKDWGNGAQP